MASIRALKEAGIAAIGPEPHRDAHPPMLPRIQQTLPRPGFIHPITRAEIVALLTFFGPVCWYGLQRITLTRGTGVRPHSLRFGSLIVPGQIVLYDQPAPPWIVPGRLPDTAYARCLAAGASITEIGGTQTVIEWPGETLRQFFLWDVLMHEIGHHILQYETGKRTARIARTRDHEAFATRYAQQCRSHYEAACR